MSKPQIAAILALCTLAVVLFSLHAWGQFWTALLLTGPMGVGWRHIVRRWRAPA
jgi:uncharacterized membrane-anchored protein